MPVRELRRQAIRRLLFETQNVHWQFREFQIDQPCAHHGIRLAQKSQKARLYFCSRTADERNTHIGLHYVDNPVGLEQNIAIVPKRPANLVHRNGLAMPRHEQGPSCTSSQVTCSICLLSCNKLLTDSGNCRGEIDRRSMIRVRSNLHRCPVEFSQRGNDCAHKRSLANVLSAAAHNNNSQSIPESLFLSP